MALSTELRSNVGVCLFVFTWGGMIDLFEGKEISVKLMRLIYYDVCCVEV